MQMILFLVRLTSLRPVSELVLFQGPTMLHCNVESLWEDWFFYLRLCLFTLSLSKAVYCIWSAPHPSLHST